MKEKKIGGNRRSHEKIRKRAEYVQQRVKELSDHPMEVAVRLVADELFLSERTIWNDLKK